MRTAAERGWCLLLWFGLLAAPLFAQPTSSDPADVVWESAWKKQGFRIIPYGSLWADMIYASERTHPGAYTLFVFSRQQHGEPAFTIDARRTRLGVNIEGPPWDELGEIRSGGQVEIDFHGNFVTENKANVLLRHAYWELTGPTFRVLVGQTWDVVSPLLPGTLNYSVGWAGGNIGFRRTQFRLERYWKSPRGVTWILQGALAQDIVADFPTDPGVQRESSDWPVLQFRAAVSWPSFHSTDSVTIGASGHWGESGFDFLEVGPPPLDLPPQDDVRIRTWSWNIDVRWPLGERAGFQGEFFHGSNLSSFLGGIGQGVCPCVRRPIRSTGGWGEFWWNWNDRLSSHVGFGIDDPRDADSLLGRTYNQFLFINLVCRWSSYLTTGFEVTHWTTRYHETRAGLIPPDELAPTEPGKAWVFQWMVQYSF